MGRRSISSATSAISRQATAKMQDIGRISESLRTTAAEI
jgi:hypothetical protein